MEVKLKKELQEKIFEAYPNIFRQKDLPQTQTAMCRGISCGDGWYTIINELCANIQNHVINENRNNPEEDNMICEALQVKEKFGGLRFYIHGGDDFIKGLVSLAESLSYRTCSECGNKSTQNKKNRGWVHTLCDTCRKQKLN
jgi:hypothetical protein